jgi:transglutaminase-like putative cysteine protease
MEYQPNVTGVDTSASQALSGRQGVCQDFAHIMLALCRANGIPARYVSGFITGEGAMHAWVEALVREPGRRTPYWMGFDPTHNRRTDTQYVTVATGRDFTDVSPVTGTFYGSKPGRLTSWSQTVARAPMS